MLNKTPQLAKANKELNKLLQQHQDLTKKLKEFITKKIRHEIQNDKFIFETRSFCEKFSNIPPSILTTESTQLLKMLAKNYLETISSEQSLITYEDVMALGAFSCENWIAVTDLEKLQAVTKNLFADAVNLRLASGDPEVCDKILRTYYKIFKITPLLFSGQSLLKDRLINCVEGMINNKLLGAAEAYLVDLTKLLGSKHELERLFYNVFLNVLKSQDIDYLTKVVEKFNINFKNYLLTINHGSENIVHASVISSVLGLKTREIQEKYLLLLKHHHIHPDSDRFSEHFDKSLHSMTALLAASNAGDLGSVKLLLKYGADLNQVVPVKNDLGQIISFRTIFSVSFGSGDLNFIKTLVYKLGADPLLAILKFKQYLSSMFPEQQNFDLNIIPSMGGQELLNKIGQQNYEQYVTNYFEIIENHFLQRLLTNKPAHKPPAIVKKTTSNQQSANKFLPMYTQKSTMIVDDANIASLAMQSSQVAQVLPVAIGHETPSSIEPNQDLLNDYINFKGQRFKQIQQDLENQFDILLLNYIKINSIANLHTLHDFISENPELEFYLVTSILQHVDQVDTVKDILMNQPEVLHKFFTYKKQHIDASLNLSKIEEKIPYGVYKVNAKLKHPLYVTIASELQEKLFKTNHLLLNKINEQIQHCKIIAANSEDISGIKIIKGIIKLKIAKEDLAIATNVKYFNTSSLATLMVFDKIVDHKFKYTEKCVVVKEVPNFYDLFAQIEANRSIMNHEQIIDPNTNCNNNLGLKVVRLIPN